MGGSAQRYPLVTDGVMGMKEFATHDVRIPNSCLDKMYLNIYIPQATQAVGTYVVGIMPVAGYITSIKHVCKTVTAAATVEVEVGAKGTVMTAQSGADTVSTATLATAVADRLGAAGDIIYVKIATASGDLLHLSVLIEIEPT
jgi:hypothetical protein